MLYLRNDEYNAKIFIFINLVSKNFCKNKARTKRSKDANVAEQPVSVAMTTNKSVVVNIHSSTESYAEV